MSMNSVNNRLVLFLTRAVSLSCWAQMGILEREIALYKKLRPHLKSLSIVTCGSREELAYQDRLGDIHILYNHWRLSPNVYSLLAPFLHWRALRSSTVYKTNQLDGAWTALLAGWIHRKPVVVRGGYAWALNFRRQQGHQSLLKGTLIRLLEGFCFKAASHIVVTTGRLKNYVISNYKTSNQDVSVIPNHVNTHLFCPLSHIKSEPGRIVFVGALKPAKNLPLLLEAVAELKRAHLVLIGDGPLRVELTQQAQSLNLELTFAGRLPNEQLPQEINRAEVFVLPSHYEGHPKALIEAMACGTAVVGTDVDGIRDVIKHAETGLLCSPTVEGLRSALQQLLANQALRIRLGQTARAFAKQQYSLDETVRKELSILQQVHAR